MTDTSAAEPAVLALPPSLDLTAAQSLKDSLVEAAMARTGIVLDGANVQRVGTPAVQVVLAAARTFAAEERTFTLRHPSNVLREAFEDLGLSEELRRWSNP